MKRGIKLQRQEKSAYEYAKKNFDLQACKLPKPPRVLQTGKKSAGYDERMVVDKLKHKGVKFQYDTALTHMDMSDAKNIGNGSLGQVAFLVNYCGYRVTGFRNMYIHDRAEKEPIKINNPLIKNAKSIII